MSVETATADRDRAERRRALQALAAFQKQGRASNDLQAMSSFLNHESDRAVVVILGSLLEDMVLDRIIGSLGTMSESDTRQFCRGSGPADSFDNRIKLARALGLFDDDIAKMLHVFRAMRNACAHSRLDLNFSTAEFRDVMALLFDEEIAAEIKAGSLTVRSIRARMVVAYIVIGDAINGASSAESRARAKSMIGGL